MLCPDRENRLHVASSLISLHLKPLIILQVAMSSPEVPDVSGTVGYTSYFRIDTIVYLANAFVQISPQISFKNRLNFGASKFTLASKPIKRWNSARGSIPLTGEELARHKR